MSEAETSGGATSETVTGTLELQESDLRAAIIESSWPIRARFGILAVVALCYGALAVSEPSTVKQMLPSLLAIGAFLVVLFITPSRRARKLLEVVAKGGDRHASYRFDADGLTLRTAGATTTAAYRSLSEYREGKTSFLIYSSPGVANVVPKRAFSPADLATVSALLAANVKRTRGRSASKIIILWFALILMFLVVWQFLSNQAPTPRPRGSAETQAPAP
jgi:hypothetical protein